MTTTPRTIPEDIVSSRRVIFMGLAIVFTLIGCAMYLRGFSTATILLSDYISMAIFPFLFSQISIGFVLALLGFYDLLRGGDRQHILRNLRPENAETVPLAATAIAVPIFNEDVMRVTEGIVNMWRSIEKTGQLEHFDFYILSDSNQPDRWVEEECAWMSLCQKLNAFGKIFYRKRRLAINGKSGNVADFCRRWGKRYRYMIVLDADSVMTGACMVTLARTMENNPQVGILQTLPHNVLGKSLFRRIFQFSGRLSSRLFSQGVSYAQYNSGSYWGHNAIIRVAPFIQYCDLPELPVPDPKRRHVLSHDTVEAALMQRAGYEVWLAYDLPGSYEEGPPSLTDMLKRDRRWCAGNLQHFWFLFARGITFSSRLHIYMGLLSYLSSPLWFAFLVATSCSIYQHAWLMVYSAGPDELALISPRPLYELLVLTLIFLFSPRVLAWCTNLGNARLFGGSVGLTVSTLLDTLFSMLFAPVFMAWHTIFVFLTLSGLQIKWTAQNRNDSGLSLGHCLVTYGWLSLFGLISTALSYHYLTTYNAWMWLLPVEIGWIVSPVLAWVTSWESWGLGTRKYNLFVIPEEVEPPLELLGFVDEGRKSASPYWVQALLSPYVHAVHLSILRQRNSDTEPSSQMSKELCERLVNKGPNVLNQREEMRVLWDAEAVLWLHQELWSRADAQLHPDWLLLLDESRRTPLLDYLLQEGGVLDTPLNLLTSAADIESSRMASVIGQTA